MFKFVSVSAFLLSLTALSLASSAFYNIVERKNTIRAEDIEFYCGFVTSTEDKTDDEIRQAVYQLVPYGKRNALDIDMCKYFLDV